MNACCTEIFCLDGNEWKYLSSLITLSLFLFLQSSQLPHLLASFLLHLAQCWLFTINWEKPELIQGGWKMCGYSLPMYLTASLSGLDNRDNSQRDFILYCWSWSGLCVGWNILGDETQHLPWLSSLLGTSPYFGFLLVCHGLSPETRMLS